MRILKFILWIYCFSLALYGCEGKQISTLSFNIQDYDGTTPKVILGYLNQAVTIDSLTGKGKIEFSLSQPSFATIQIRKYDKRLIYLEPGNDLSVSYSLKEGEKKVSFTGDLATQNEFLQRNDVYVFPRFNPAEKDLGRIVGNMDSLMQINRQKLEEFSFPKAFSTLENKRLTANALLQLTRMPTIDQALYLQTMKERFVQDSTYMTIPVYLEFLDQYVIRRLPQLTGDSSLDEPDRKVAVILDNVTDASVRSYLIDLVLFSTSELGDPKYKELYLQHVKNPERLAAFAEACKKSERIMPGNPCPDFTFRDINDRAVSLADLKGKYVYMDIWATWCGPCKWEMKFLPELEERLAGKDITFVSLSIDQNKDIKKWKQMVADMQLKGVQLHLGENWTWLKNFMPASLSVPRFILLDREGKIVTANMTRPSDKETLKKLESLLQ